MPYREFTPPKALANIIECVWTRLPDGAPFTEQREQLTPESDAHTVLPDGAMDVITTFHPDGELDDTFVVGAMTGPQLAALGNHALIGIRFLPGAGGSALGINAATLTDLQVTLRDIRVPGSQLSDAFRALHIDAGNAHALHLFANSLRINSDRIPPIVREATHRLAGENTNYRVEHVAKQLGISRQHLTRVFTAHSGLTPKQFAQICRVRALLAAVQSRDATTRNTFPRPTAKTVSWSRLAAEFGYTDQSHLISEVRAIIGKTPAQWHAARGSNIPIARVPVAPI